MTIQLSMSHYLPWSFDAFWNKSVTYAKRSQQKTDESVFWSLLVLEFLPRAVLAKIDPILLAEENEDIMTVFEFPKFPAKDIPPKSIPITAVFERCKRIISDFNEEEKKSCLYYINLRNQEIHTGELLPCQLPFEYDYYRIIKLLVTHCEKTLEELFGNNHAEYIDQLLKDFEKRQIDDLAALIMKAKNSFEALSSNEQQAKQTQALGLVQNAINVDRGALINTPITFQKLRQIQCPVCLSNALLTIRSISETYDAHPEYEKAKISLVFRASDFWCFGCDLTISSLTKLLAVSKIQDERIKNTDIPNRFEEMTHTIQEIIEVPVTDLFGTHFDYDYAGYYQDDYEYGVED